MTVSGNTSIKTLCLVSSVTTDVEKTLGWKTSAAVALKTCIAIQASIQELI
jgi:hypothetical protein